MNALARQQQALLDALFVERVKPNGDTFFTGARGLMAYRANAHALAERSLLATYPVIAQLLGDESFKLLARDFWHHHPPTRGDLTQWGEELASFLQVKPQLAEEPYLGDVARVEWALHRAANDTDRARDPASFALLSTVEPDALTLVLSSGTAVINSVYPVASIINAHLKHDPALVEVGRKLRAQVPENALVWRQGFRPELAECSAAEAVLVQALLSGAPLLAALEQSGGLDFNQWLPPAVQTGLVLGARPLAAAA